MENIADFASSGLSELLFQSGEGFSSSPVSLVFNLLAYILTAIGMYTIAKRRGINHAWLAWIPLGQSWMLGCISDQYRYVVRHEEKSKRKALLILDLLTCVLTVAMVVVLFLSIFDLIQAFGLDLDLELADLSDAVALRLTQKLGWVIILGLAALAVGIAAMVVKYMACHDLFASCNPNNKTVFLVLGILSGTLLAIFIFVCRKKDFGMPPRKVNPEPEMWTPPAPPAEPWEN